MLLSFFPFQGLGAIPVPGTSLLVPKDIVYRAGASSAVAFIGDRAAIERYQQVESQCPTIRTALFVRVDDGETVPANSTARTWQDVFDEVPEQARWEKLGSGPKELAIICRSSIH
jgi:acyl-coenzyme A synthetase/AMP-(fatty) acid ligase